jgi:hypothetical protein
VAKRHGLSYGYFVLSGAGLGLLVGGLFPTWHGLRNERKINALSCLVLGGIAATTIGFLLYQSDSYREDFDNLRMGQWRLKRDYNSMQDRLLKRDLSEPEARKLLDEDLIPRAKELLDQAVSLLHQDLSASHRNTLGEWVGLYRLRWESLKLSSDALGLRDPQKLAQARTDWENAQDPPLKGPVKVTLLGFLGTIFWIWLRRKLLRPGPRAWKQYPVG